MTRIALNGFGRIGRMALKSILERNLDLEVVAINDLTDNETLAHLFAFDSTFGRFDGTVSAETDSLSINGKKIPVFSERDPENLPWKDLKVDIVLECTGFFRTREGAGKHISAGAKRVIISAPGKDAIDGTFVMGVNEKDFNPEKDFIISNASCTTNCLAPVVKVLDEAFGIKEGLMTTIHSFTNDQSTLDAPHKDLRRARTASASMIPTTTGAAKAVALVLPQLEGKLNGMAIRVPTEDVSLVDLCIHLNKKASAEEINAALSKAANTSLKGILDVETRPLVSRDFLKNSFSSIVDAPSTMVMGDMVKVLSWYDNEWGYASRLCDLAVHVG